MRQLSFLASMLLFPATVFAQPAPADSGEKHLSHPALRTAPPPSNRAMTSGPARFVDPNRGDDAGDGSQQSPWKTLRHALAHLKAGDTLYLRGGTYRENLHVALVGEPDAPITIRSFPGEQAIVDGGIAEFFDSPASAWQPVEGGAAGEFRSARPYPNLRNVMGWFGDSMVGLQTYYHAHDLRAENQLVDWEDWNNTAKSDLKPLYCGPGLSYDAATGYIYARLSHTAIPAVPNYRGQTDPRKLPLVIAPFRSVPLHLDGVRHMRLQDLVIRGGGYDTVAIDQSNDLELDNVTVWCGTYGLRVTGTQRLKLHRCGVYGSIAPWLARGDTSLRSGGVRGDAHRNITRYNTHALLVAEAGREFSVYAFPLNDDWEISHCEFTEGSDGLYLGGISMHFHHNLVENMQDDGLYLSQMYPRHWYARSGATIRIEQNVIRRALTALAFGGSETDTKDTIYFCRNVVELKQPVFTGRPSTRQPQPAFSLGHTMGDHGSPPWPAMFIYHNTFVQREAARSHDLWLPRGATAERPRRMFNNIVLHGENLPKPQVLDSPYAQIDGNLYWQMGLDASRAATYFDAFRSSSVFEKSKTAYPPGFEARSLVVDPKFIRAEMSAEQENDYRLQQGSPAIDAGVDLPADWPDPSRAMDKGKPDIGALPLGAEAIKVGRSAP
ncbi:MAG: DUF1565 domain-containing protein [Planctomycetia bacterium]|nr:DUF1565 domain-containing protein [Planctomycetia bacterium]